ncbi:MAG: ATP-binding protein [Oscillospiraceae bacterium]|nr:ATP-binding protein [Oscillospiraceae bacterium]
MRRTVITKLLVINMSLIILIHVIISISISMLYKSYIYNKIKDDDKVYSQLIYKIYSLNKNKLKLEDISDKLDLDIILFDDKGSTNLDMMKYSSYPKSIEPNLHLKEEYFKELEYNNIVELKGKFFDGSKASVYSIFVPIFANNKLQLIVNINTELSDIDSLIWNANIFILIFGVIMLILSSLFLLFFSKKAIVNPLKKFNDVLYKISTGEVNKRVDFKSNDEFGTLANSLNKMADSIENSERNRQEFISNVSHELRSPITSINGFISGMLDGVIPESKTKHYLSIASNEIKRLIRLINDLLDLSSIDNQSLNIDIEKIDIVDLIKFSVEKFIPKMKQKNLLLDLEFEESKLMVLTCKDKIIQVLTNLIDNAVKYSKKEGRLSILVISKGNKVYVSIYNEGNQIPEESLNRLWERFYRIDKSRTSKESTGLGLSIVRAIIGRLKEDIWVENVGTTGVEFTFTIQKAN